jgi:hypothetical protein
LSLTSKSKSNNSLPEDVLPIFRLLDASVYGGEMIISDPLDWQKLEDEYLVATFAKTAILDDLKIDVKTANPLV